MPHDDIDHIPPIVPTRDTETPRPAARAAAGRANGGAQRVTAGRKPVPPRSGSGALLRLVVTVSLVVAAVACAWAWQLQEQLDKTTGELAQYAQRISDLEDRLSDTDEGMSQSAEAMAVKIKELYAEVDKLWASAWRTNKAKIEELEGKAGSHDKKLAAAERSLSDLQSQLKGAVADLAKLKGVAGDLQRLAASGKTNQAEVERVADTLNRINLDLAKLNKRVQGNEEWINSINAFRKQVNASIVELQAALRARPAGP